MKKFAIAGMVLACGVMAGCQNMQTGSSAYRADRSEAKDMQLVGFTPLQRRSAYQPLVHKQGNRFIAYVGHHGGVIKTNPLTGVDEFNGTSIIDVTDPKNPKYLSHVPGMQG